MSPPPFFALTIRAIANAEHERRFSSPSNPCHSCFHCRRDAERSVGAPCTPSNLLATLYGNVLGIDPALTYPNFAGRPLYVLDERTKIRELL